VEEKFERDEANLTSMWAYSASGGLGRWRKCVALGAELGLERLVAGTTTRALAINTGYGTRIASIISSTPISNLSLAYLSTPSIEPKRTFHERESPPHYRNIQLHRPRPLY
tara:strand:+ start:1407 stop:1739 length:333 start_codon:yes stop_codon:yes gene_type:complete